MFCPSWWEWLLDSRPGLGWQSHRYKNQPWIECGITISCHYACILNFHSHISDSKSAEPWYLPARNGTRIKIPTWLFGTQDAGSRVAVSLGDCGTYLQEPHAGLYYSPYNNPQLLPLPDLSDEPRLANINLPATLSIDDLEDTDDRSEINSNRDSAQLDDLLMDIDAFYDQLPLHHTAPKALIDTRILSPLFGYSDWLVTL